MRLVGQRHYRNRPIRPATDAYPQWEAPPRIGTEQGDCRRTSSYGVARGEAVAEAVEVDVAAGVADPVSVVSVPGGP